MSEIAWERLLAAEHEFAATAFHDLYKMHDIALRFEEGLRSPNLRGSCLRLLLIYDSENLKRALFGTLVELASVTHSDIGLVRALIATMHREWVGGAIQPIVDRILDGPLENPSEEYRRFAELYDLLYAELLPELLARALAHDDPDVRDVGHDFG